MRVRDVAHSSGPKRSALPRVRLDGKFLRAADERFLLRGVTYGPFRAGADGELYPDRSVVEADLQRIRELGANTIRTFTPPPVWWLDAAAENELRVLVGIPWAQHVCFLADTRAAAGARRAVRETASRIGRHSAVLGLLVGNEIPPDVIRWERAARVEAFLAELADEARQCAPEALVSYASYPSTEYLGLEFADFISFNVYLERTPDLRRYLARLHNIADDKPLVLTELGLDSTSHGEVRQATLLREQIRTAFEAGAAGAVVFSYTDEWFAEDALHPDGGASVEGWSFGLVSADRQPKPSFHSVREAFAAPGPELPAEPPEITVVVCAFNEERTIAACLRSLEALDYPNFEVVVVNDGSTDQTGELADARACERLRVVHQPNAGLSAARNRGIAEARGSIVAFTDADCVVDREWLRRLAPRFVAGAVAVGGPNLSPANAPRVASIVSAAPGLPTHVLLDDRTAEHVPGCNMAFDRAVLRSLGGFRERYRVAGDDVDLCWRLQDAGYEIAFQPDAFVWHERRPTARAYLRQQRGYGRAEARLWRDHPGRFDRNGAPQWRGRIYGGVGRAFSQRQRVFRGPFGGAPFQSIYSQPGTTLEALPLTLAWSVFAWPLALLGPTWGGRWWLGAGPLLVTFATAGRAAFRARVPKRVGDLRGRLLLLVLFYLGPLVRDAERFRHGAAGALGIRWPGLPWQLPRWSVGREEAFWTVQGAEKTELCASLDQELRKRGLPSRIESGWTEWDLEVGSGLGGRVRLEIAMEDHGELRRRVRARRVVLPAPRWLASGAAVLGAAGLGIGASSLPGLACLGAAALALGVARRTRTLDARVAAVVQDVLRTNGFSVLARGETAS